MSKENWKDIGKIALLSIVLGFTAGMVANNIKQAETIEQLEAELYDTKEQLIIADDQLNQINMRNEAIYYIKQLEEQEANEIDE